MSTSPLTPREQYRETVALIAQKAKAKLPECNGRVEKATALVLGGDVTLHADGTATVYSATDPTRRYELGSSHEGYCMCKDWEQAPQHLCKHRLAAMMAKRVQELVGHDHEDGGTPDGIDAPAPAPAPVAQTYGNPHTFLPEAPVSVNVKVQISGREVMVTLRGTSEDEVLARLEHVVQRYPPPQPPAPPAPRQRASGPVQEIGWCAVHNTEMTLNQKDGRQWWSHRTADGWCKGKKGR